MTLHAPQLILIVLSAIGTGVAIAKNGEPRGPYSFVACLVGDAIVFGLLWWGGFFG